MSPDPVELVSGNAFLAGAHEQDGHDPIVEWNPASNVCFIVSEVSVRDFGDGFSKDLLEDFRIVSGSMTMGSEKVLGGTP